MKPHRTRRVALHDAPVIDFEDALFVGVAEETDADAGKVVAQVLGVLEEMPRAGHVLLYIAHSPVREEEALLDHSMRRKLAQVRASLRGERTPRALEGMHRLVRAALE